MGLFVFNIKKSEKSHTTLRKNRLHFLRFFDEGVGNFAFFEVRLSFFERNLFCTIDTFVVN